MKKTGPKSIPKEKKMISRTITLRPDQIDWVKRQPYNFSETIRNLINKVIKNEMGNEGIQ